MGEGGEHRLGERVPAARRQQRVDVALGALAGDRAQRGARERLGQQPRRERDRQPSRDQAADGELVARDRDQARLEAGGAAGADDEPVGVGGGPVVVGEVADAHRLLAGEPMVGRKGDEERLAHEVAPLGAFELASRERGVLEVDGEVELSGADALGQLVGAALLDGDPGARMGGADLRDGRRHEARERGREGADAQERALVVGDLGELERGEVEAHGDRVGVLEQQRAGRGELQPARPAIEQPRADLLLEGRHLMRDRGLRERELLARRA